MISEEALEAAAEVVADHVGYGWVGADHREIAREILEAAAPYMQPVVATREELDALPRLSVIRSNEGTVFEKFTMWHEAGSRDLKYSPDIALPATVLQVGWGAE